MAGRITEKLGANYGYWTIISDVCMRKKHGNKLKAYWLCRCVCGKEAYIRGCKLRSGESKSCGCKRPGGKKGVKWKSTPKYLAGRIEDHHVAGTYRSWDGMNRRCYDTNSPSFKDYGGRGIEVCERWHTSFDNFCTDMGLRPEGMSIDRINVNGNYEPDNCKWSSRLEQRNNCRNTVHANGEPLSEYCRRHGLDRRLLYPRLKKGMTIEQAVKDITTP